MIFNEKVQDLFYEINNSNITSTITFIYFTSSRDCLMTLKHSFDRAKSRL